MLITFFLSVLLGIILGILLHSFLGKTFLEWLTSLHYEFDKHFNPKWRGKL